MNIKAQNHTITAIIPTCNGAETLGEFFASLKRQHRFPDEVLVVDSSSTDKTVDLCRSAGAEVAVIPQGEFDHGGTRSELARRARGEIVVFFTQDAILARRDALETLIAPLLHNENVACAYGRQLPKKNASPLAAHLRLFNYPPQSSIRTFADRRELGLKTIFISNSFAAYKKQCLAEVDYFKNGLIFGEDTCTLGRLLQVGYAVAYVAEAEVYHSHNYSLVQEFSRSFDIGVLHSSENWLLDTYGRAEGEGVRYIQSVFSKLLRERRYLLLPDCLLRSALKLIGYQLGRSHKKIPYAWRPFLSMNRLWWQRQ
jgi:rhamnosyltransferase